MQHTWYALNLGDALLAGPQLDRITQLFQVIRTEHPQPDTPALFVRHESEGKLHCDVIVYFPPALELLAQQLQASHCAAPSANDLGLLAGDNRAWTIWFPDR